MVAVEAATEVVASSQIESRGVRRRSGVTNGELQRWRLDEVEGGGGGAAAPRSGGGAAPKAGKAEQAPERSPRAARERTGMTHPDPRGGDEPPRGKREGRVACPPAWASKQRGSLARVKFPRGPRAQGKGLDPGGNLGCQTSP